MKLLILNLYWVFTSAYLRLCGAEVGRKVKCNGFPYVKVRKGGRLVIGNNVQINAARWANAHVVNGSTNFYVAENAKLIIGNEVGLSGTRIVAICSIEIKEGTMIGAGCLICDSDMHEVPLGSPNGIDTKPIVIGSKVFIGAQSILLKGTSIGDGAVVGAGSVVTGPVGASTLVAGNPARMIREFSTPEENSPKTANP